MIKNIQKGQTLLVKGPTRITLLEGKLDVIGKIISPENEKSTSSLSEFDEDNVIIIPGANHYPLFALENSKLEIYTSNEIENLTLIEENSISSRWVEIKDTLLEYIKNNESETIKIMVLGISSGKTTIIKYFAPQ